MQEITGDLWKPETYLTEEKHCPPSPEVVCITTNGFVKQNGEAVMGRGCAKYAAIKWKGMSQHLGLQIQEHGNIVQILARVSIGTEQRQLVSFPVKPQGEICKTDKSNIVRHMHKQFKPRQMVPGWACTANMNLIRQSARQLVLLATDMEWNTIVLPRPGCGAGELEWKDVKPILQDELDNRFYVITYRK